MRLGGPVFGDVSTPSMWIAALRAAGYRAAYCPVGDTANLATMQSYADAAAEADIVIAEVGAWSNPLATDPAERSTAIAYCQRRLAQADVLGARCCVNISGSRGAQWDGPHRDNLTPETFDMIVETVRTIIDAVQPCRTFYALETMPNMYPDSPDNYLRLMQAIDRPRFAVHLDPVNMISSPQRYYDTGSLLGECFAKLGSHIKGCHAKDITLDGRLMVHLDEVRPGLGALDYRVFLREMNRLDPDAPLMLEHLPSPEEYACAAGYIRGVAQELGVTV